MDRPALMMMMTCVNGDNTCDVVLASCTNTDGSNRCGGNERYQKNGVECEDVNEFTNDHCHADAHCTNNVGSFVCTKI